MDIFISYLTSFAIIILFRLTHADSDSNNNSNWTTHRQASALICNPFERSTVPKNINVTFRIYNFVEIEDVDQTISVMGTFVMSWYDDCVWNFATQVMPERAKVQDFLAIDSSYPMWRPKIVLMNSATDTILAVDRNSAGYPVTVYPDGLVQSNAGGLWVARCSMNHEIFPFDTQNCDYIFEVWLDDSYTNITKANAMFLSSQQVTSPTCPWDFVSITAVVQNDECFALTSNSGDNQVKCWPKSVFRLTMTRKYLPYVFSVFIPVICVSILQMATLAIPGDLPDRTIFSTTLLLSFVILQTQVKQSVPQSAVVVLLMVYFNANILASMVMTTYVAIIICLVEIASRVNTIRKADDDDDSHCSESREVKIAKLRKVDYGMLLGYMIFYITLHLGIGIRIKILS